MEDNKITKKIIISGLDNAGKTSILKALDKKYDFQQEILELKPTIKVEYSKTTFLGIPIIFWDMGGQEIYRNLYQKNKDVYFAETDLLFYIIDIQDRKRFKASLEYLRTILNYFLNINEAPPVVVSFHKYDPEIRSYEEINVDVRELREIIIKEYPAFKILFQQTSIYDIISIVQLISYGLSVFDHKFFELSLLFEKFLLEFQCTSLILFDKNGIIVSEYYSDMIEPEIYVELIESIKEHLQILKKLQEENYEHEFGFSSIEDKLLSCMQEFKIGENSFFLSALIKEERRELLLKKFPDFIEELNKLLETLSL